MARTISKEEEVNYNAVEAQLGRVFLVKLYPHADLTKSILKLCEDKGIEYAYFNIVDGSFERANFGIWMDMRGMPEDELKMSYGLPFRHLNIEIPTPSEMLCGSGMVCDAREPGKKDVIVHCAIGNTNGAGTGGHMHYPTNALTGLQIILFEIKGGKIVRKPDQYGTHTDFDPE